MRRLFVFSFLSLFLFSTAATYGSVHHCEGELTDIAMLSVASCQHDEVAIDHCVNTCCKDDEKHDDKEADDCCDTEELSAVKNLITQVATVDVQLISKILPSFYDFYFEHHKVLRKTYGVAYVSPVHQKDITIKVQSFLI